MATVYAYYLAIETMRWVLSLCTLLQIIRILSESNADNDKKLQRDSVTFAMQCPQAYLKYTLANIALIQTCQSSSLQANNHTHFIH